MSGAQLILVAFFVLTSVAAVACAALAQQPDRWTLAFFVLISIAARLSAELRIRKA